jgi:hypothetical protein
MTFNLNCFTADVTIMYRQILVPKEQQHLQQILWLSVPSEDIKAYILKTVTYSTASEPFLATCTLQQLAEDERENFPKAAIIAKRDFYVADVLSGSNYLPEALHKWFSKTTMRL